MKIEKIKPIPKYIQKKIKLYDDKLKTAPFGRTRFYAYFTKNDGELVKVTVAVKEKRNKWYCKQVAVHGVHSDKCFVKDMNFTYIAGYKSIINILRNSQKKLKNNFERKASVLALPMAHKWHVS